MIRINEILDKIVEYNPDANLEVVEKAYVFSARVHDGQMRLSGEPYLSHPLEVAGILADMKLDVESIAAGLLHDVIEDTHSTADELKKMFGDGVAHIVSGVTKLSKLPSHSSESRQAESIRKMILAMADDIRVILIKLADRIHNMRTLKYHKKEHKKIAIAQETFDIYVPIANRLGIYWIKQELEDISFKYLQPDEYGKIENLVRKSRDEREEFVTSVKSAILDKMDTVGLNGEVLGRYKQFYSIYNKMVTQGLDYEEVYDIIAFRIILESVPQCYEALGHIHSMWTPIPKKFKDYIGVPKPNMYQSLHTTVVGPNGDRFEVQIRTHDMDSVAKSGIAAHWSYKEGERYDPKEGGKFSWIQNLVENQENFNDPSEFMENVRIDLYPDEVYVFTPRGDVKSLPKGATPVDFAYMVHTEVGNECTGSKVNGRIVPLQYQLKSGDTVEVITTKGQHPSQDWLGFVKTVKARSKVRQWIKIQDNKLSIDLGKELCEKEFRKNRLSFNNMAKTEKMDEVVHAFGMTNPDDLIANVGYGKITPRQVLHKFAPDIREKQRKEPSIFDKFIGKSRKKKGGEGIVVRGINDMLIRFGKCCQPVPGDSITGYITQGQGVTVHRASCKNVHSMNPERIIEAVWNEDITESYPVKIRVRSHDRFGLLADITTNISKNGANIVNVHTETHDNAMVDTFFTITVSSTDQLKKVLLSIKRIKYVQEVKRISN